jgi:hypothetical protein
MFLSYILIGIELLFQRELPDHRSAPNPVVEKDLRYHYPIISVM